MSALLRSIIAVSAAVLASAAVARAETGDCVGAACPRTVPSCVADSGPSCCGEECDLNCCDCAPRWTVSAGAIFLHRSRPRNTVLVTDGTTDDVLVSVSDFGLGTEAGPRLEVNRQMGCGWEIGAVYFGVDGWSSSHALADPGNLRVPLVSDDPDDYFDSVNASYKSRLYNAEVNAKRRLGDNVKFLAGFRYIELDERIVAGAFSPDLEGTFGAQVNNYLFGFQMGGEAAIWNKGGPFRVDSFLKAGVFGTHSRANVQATGTYLDINETATDDRTSFVGELGVVANYQLGRQLSVFGGYQLLWIEGVSLASDLPAALTDADADIASRGSPFYHGAMTGINFNW